MPGRVPGLFNPWRETCSDDTALNGSKARLARLAAHLGGRPRFLVCGEASGYLGARHSAIAFTSERLLLEGAIPRVPAPAGRLTQRTLPYSEPSATIVWKALYRLGIERETILWNALPLHPYRQGHPHSNRTPTDRELFLGIPAMRLLLKAFPRVKLIAAGRKAEALLERMGIAPLGTVRHPANGGASAFSEGLKRLIR